MSAVRPLDAEAIRRKCAPFAGAMLRGITRRVDVSPRLGANCLLHAGPPLTDGELPAPLKNAAVQALVYEGRSPDAAVAAVEDGSITFLPAQDHGIATPLAQMVSASMPLFAVGDDALCRYAPIAEGPPPALRFGSADADCAARMRCQADWAFDVLRPRLAKTPVAVADLVARALADGDECHARTGMANAALAEALGELPPAFANSIAENANYVLPVLMAAAAWVLATTDASIAAVGGNGLRFGIRAAGAPGWRTVRATPPVGTRLPDRAPDAPVLGAVGDSPVIDFCGLGGQALAFAPALVEAWATQLPADWSGRAAAVTDPTTGLVSAAHVLDSGRVPIVHLAMVSAQPQGGLAGRGFYEPDPVVFR